MVIEHCTCTPSAIEGSCDTVNVQSTLLLTSVFTNAAEPGVPAGVVTPCDVDTAVGCPATPEVHVICRPSVCGLVMISETTTLTVKADVELVLPAVFTPVTGEVSCSVRGNSTLNSADDGEITKCAASVPDELNEQVTTPASRGALKVHSPGWLVLTAMSDFCGSCFPFCTHVIDTDTSESTMVDAGSKSNVVETSV